MYPSRIALWIFVPASDQRLAPLRHYLSLALGVFCCCSATSILASNSSTGVGGASSYMGCPLPRTPSSVGRKPCGQDPPSLRPDGVGQGRTKVVDEEGDDADADVDEELGRSSSDRWVPSSGPPVCVFCVPGPFGPVAPLFPPRRVLRRGFLGSCFICRHYLILESI
jgi:hypothetical protein